jgi:predicted anti-sigma-YlaC factor YlaD
VDCSKLLEELSDYLDREAREDLCRAIEEHLKSCHDCRIVVDKTRKTILLYQSDQAQPVPAAVNARLQEALTQEYRARSASGAVD